MCLLAGLEGDKFGKMRATDKEERDKLRQKGGKDRNRTCRRCYGSSLHSG